MAAEIPKKFLFLIVLFLIASQACADYCTSGGCSDAPQEPEQDQMGIDFSSIIGSYGSEALIFVFIFFIFAFLLYSMLYIPTHRISSSLTPFIQTSKAFKRDFMRYGREYREKKLADYANSRSKKGVASEILCCNFIEITPQVREKTLEKISGETNIDERVSLNTARTVLKNFKLIPVELRNSILLKLSEKKSEDMKLLISEILLSEFNKIPADLRINLISMVSSGKLKKTKENSIQIVYMNFTDIPKELREKIILDGINSLEIEETYIKAAIQRNKKNLPKELIDYASKKIDF